MDDLVAIFPLVIAVLMFLQLRRVAGWKYALIPAAVNILVMFMAKGAGHRTVYGHILICLLAFEIMVFGWYLMAAYALWCIHWIPHLHMSRRTIAVTAASMTLAAVIAGAIQGCVPLVSHHDIVSDKVPSSADGYKLMLISDLHFRQNFPQCVLERLSRIIAEEKPDVILDAGDLVDLPLSGEPIPRLVDAVRQWQVPDGVFCCDGNHDAYSGFPLVDRWRQAANIASLGQRCHKPSVLMHDWLRIAAQDGRGPLVTCPQDNASENRRPYTILLRHHPPIPAELEKSEKPYGYDLILSGHTHGGQIFPVNFIVRAIYRFTAGRFHDLDEYSRLYICRGTYLWGVPIRFMVPGEVVIFTFRRK